MLCVLVTQSCPTLCDPMDCSLPGVGCHSLLHNVCYVRCYIKSCIATDLCHCRLDRLILEEAFYISYYDMS